MGWNGMKSSLNNTALWRHQKKDDATSVTLLDLLQEIQIFLG